MLVLNAQDLSSLLTPTAVVDALRKGFIQGAEVPLRHHHTIPAEQGSGTLLIMPAWCKRPSNGALGGIKIVHVYPENPGQNLPSIQGSYFLFDQSTGTPLAVMDGSTLTLHRTAAASVLAASFLARPESQHLLMVGTGRMAPSVIKAYTAVFPILHIKVWGRNVEKAEATCHSLEGLAATIEPAIDLEEAVKWADIISCATTSSVPLIHGEWLLPGQHVDLIGSFTPEMRESDDRLIERASIFVDTREGAFSEAGDLIQPLKKGLISEHDILADLTELCRADHPGRTGVHEITLFKSVGTALEDLAAAELAFKLASPDLTG